MNGTEPSFKPLHPQARQATVAAGVVSCAVAAVALWLAAGAAAYALPLPGRLVAGIAVAAGLAVLAGALVQPLLNHSRTSYRVDEDGLQIRRGVLWRSHVFVPRSRIQHTDVAQGPMQRMFDLGTLMVFTAGSKHSRTRLRGILLKEARRLRDDLTDRGDGGGDGATDDPAAP